MDGSAAPFVEILQSAGIIRFNRPNYFMQMLEPIEAKEGDRFIAIYPSDHFDISYTISFNHPWLRKQEKIEEKVFAELRLRSGSPGITSSINWLLPEPLVSFTKLN